MNSQKLKLEAIAAVAALVIAGSALAGQEDQLNRANEVTSATEIEERGGPDEGLEPEQEVDEIETDRDSFTPATTTAGCGRVIFESAYSFIDNRSVPETHSYPEFLLRYGIAESLELRLGWNYEIGGAGNPISANIEDDFDPSAALEESANILYGLKYKLADEESAVADCAVMLHGSTPTYGEHNDTSVATTCVFGRTLPNQWVWDSAIRYSTGSHEEDHFNVWAPSTVLKVPCGESWKAHVEYFGIFSDGRESETVQHFVSPGAHYLITSDFEVGARFGWGLNDQSPEFFINVGVGYRF